MKNVISSLLILAFSFNTFACNFSKDITRNANGSYTYSKECHIEVGKRLQANELRKEQVEKLQKTIELKDLLVVKTEERVELWRDTSFKLEDRINTIDRVRQNNFL